MAKGSHKACLGVVPTRGWDHSELKPGKYFSGFGNADSASDNTFSPTHPSSTNSANVLEVREVYLMWLDATYTALSVTSLIHKHRRFCQNKCFQDLGKCSTVSLLFLIQILFQVMKAEISAS